jgi:hypothetical protein
MADPDRRRAQARGQDEQSKRKTERFATDALAIVVRDDRPARITATYR